MHEARRTRYEPGDAAPEASGASACNGPVHVKLLAIFLLSGMRITRFFKNGHASFLNTLPVGPVMCAKDSN